LEKAIGKLNENEIEIELESMQEESKENNE